MDEIRVTSFAVLSYFGVVRVMFICGENKWYSVCWHSDIIVYDNSGIETNCFGFISFASKLAKQITPCVAQYHCKAIKLASGE